MPSILFKSSPVGLVPRRVGLVAVGLLLGLALAGYDPALRAVSSAQGGASATQLEDIRSSQNSALAPAVGRVEKVRRGARVFLDAEDVLVSVPEEFLGRSFIQSSKSGGVKAICKKAGYVYAVTASKGSQAKRLAEKGFKQLDFPEFQVLGGDEANKALAYQKPAAEGETLEFGPWVLLIFGPEERGGVPYAKMRSLEPPAFLPDGSEFMTWEAPLKFSKTYYVDQSHPKASDSNPGTKETPFKTINQAAEVLQAGERVVVGAGVYREWVRPARGGTDPEHMISYEVAPGAKVVIKGSEILRVQWMKSIPWLKDESVEPSEATVKKVWMARLPGELFNGYNPFAVANFRQINQMNHFDVPQVFSYPRSKSYLQVRGLIFQTGKRLKQVSRYTELFMDEGSFWVEPHGLTIHIAPRGGIDPNDAAWELTAREQIFAPETYHLGYIRVKGFIMEHAGNGFPFPQRGAISTMHGHHWLIEDNSLQWVNGVGIDIGDGGISFFGSRLTDTTDLPPTTRAIPTRPDILGYHILRGNTLNDIGTTGITGPGAYGSLIEENVHRRNAWHDVEFLAECAAIKLHTNLNLLVRQNLIFDTLHGTGIWIDWINSNSRITQNVVVNTGSHYGPGPGLGGIYVEAAFAPNLVDHNFVWGCTYSNGIYEYSATKVIIAHNMIGHCAGAGILIMDVPGRSLGDLGTIPVGANTVVNNILINNGWNVGLYSPHNVSDYNLLGNARQPRPFHVNGKMPRKLPFAPSLVPFEELELAAWRKRYGFDIHSSEADIVAEFNPTTLELAWSVRGEFAEGLAMSGMTYDFWNRPRAGRTVVPGPFGSIPRETTRIVVDPRLPGN